MRARWNDLPLRLRLTFLYVGLLLLLLIALGSFLYIDTRNFLISATSFRLRALANTSISHLAPPPPPDSRTPPTVPDPLNPITSTIDMPAFSKVAPNLVRDLTWQDYAAVIFDNTGTQIATGTEFTGQMSIPRPEPDALASALNGEHLTYLTTISNQEMLGVLIPIHYPRIDSEIVGVVQMMTPLGIIDQVMQRQGVLIVIGVIIALGIAAVGGLWLTQTALEPLRLMIGTSRRIAAGDLSQRVNLPQHRDEVGQLASAFDEMVAQLDDTFTAQHQFVADASHELRTPLTAISGLIEVLLLKPEGDPETTRRVLNGVRREVERLTRLVSDLLTLTRLDARHSLNRQPVDLAVLGREVIENLKPLAKGRTLRLETKNTSKCIGDADQLKQVFYNLLGNAIQATDAEKGLIVLRVQGSGQSVQVSVTDNGSGIPEHALPHVFERFYRVDKARARASGGSGLGLAIVQAIVERHGGVVEPVESTLSRGTTIRFKLPCDTAKI